MSVAGEQAYSVEYSYDKSNRLKTEIKTSGGNIETTSYKYDINGNQTEKAVNGTKVWSGDYNGFNELTKVVDNGVTALYKYDGNGLRISKTVDGVTTNHIWDGAQIVLDMDASWNLNSKYTRGLNLIYREGEYGRNREYYVFNGHGDVVQLTDSNGNVVRTYDYDAFGVEKNPDEADTNPFRYCGEYWDKETGMIYLRARYYNPAIGRFITEDPIMYGLNWYIYAINNPLKYIDPTGHQPNQMSATSLSDFIAKVKEVEKQHPYVGSMRILYYISPETPLTPEDEHSYVFYDSWRYIYTEEAGWIDMQHFLAAARQSIIYGRRNTEILGFGNEIGQCSDKETFFSYEDLPSNKHGAIFGENLLCSELLGIFLLKKPKKLSEYLEEYFNELGAMDPKEAPNYEYIPRFDNAENSAKNFTSRKIVPYIPKTPQPLPKPGPRPVPTPSS